MIYEINETHDPNLKSWVESANAPDTDFPIQNLPFCVFRTKDDRDILGVRIGDFVLNLADICNTLKYSESSMSIGEDEESFKVSLL